jgi:hypothetical protein
VTQATNGNKGIAGAVVVMVITGFGIAWIAYSTLFPQGVLTFILLLIYAPIAGVVAMLLYMKLRR